MIVSIQMLPCRLGQCSWVLFLSRGLLLPANYLFLRSHYSANFCYHLIWFTFISLLPCSREKFRFWMETYCAINWSRLRSIVIQAHITAYTSTIVVCIRVHIVINHVIPEQSSTLMPNNGPTWRRLRHRRCPTSGASCLSRRTGSTGSGEGRSQGHTGTWWDFEREKRRQVKQTFLCTLRLNCWGHLPLFKSIISI